MFCHCGTRTIFVLTNVYVRENWESQWLRSNHSSTSLFLSHCTQLFRLKLPQTVPVFYYGYPNHNKYFMCLAAKR